MTEKKMEAAEFAKMINQLPKEGKQILYGFAMGMLVKEKANQTASGSEPRAAG